MKVESKVLVDQLAAATRSNQQQAQQFLDLEFSVLNFRTSNDSWSILECIEHLNLYGDFYIPEITKRIANSRTAPEKYFSSFLLGNYFAQSMLPREKLNKMKTFKSMNPLGSDLDTRHLSRFIHQQEEILQLLNKARSVSLSKTKTAISISNLIKLKLGDTFRVVVYHNQRHIAQALRILNHQQKNV